LVKPFSPQIATHQFIRLVEQHLVYVPRGVLGEEEIIVGIEGEKLKGRYCLIRFRKEKTS